MQERNTAQVVADKPRAFDETQLARRWDISVRTPQPWRRMGIGPIYLKLGNRVNYCHRDIEQYERRRCISDCGSSNLTMQSENRRLSLRWWLSHGFAYAVGGPTT
jgi:hypothetical protein